MNSIHRCPGFDGRWIHFEGLGENWTVSESFAAARDMPRSSQPAAIVCLSTCTPLAFCKATRSLGLVIARDLSVIAYGDSPTADVLEPELTAIKREVA